MALEDGQVTVEIFFPEAPFGGVQIDKIAEVPVLVELNTGSPVRSVFGRIGDIVANCNDYANCYSAGGGAVASVFGRTGAVVAATNDYNFNQLAGVAATTQAGLPAGGTAGQILQKNSSTPYDTGWITQTTTTESIWNFKNVVTMADPSSGNVRVNNALFGSATAMAISKNDLNGTDRTPLLASLQIGDVIEVQDQTNAVNWARYNISAAVINNSTWFQIPITFVTGSGTNPGNNDNLLLTFNVSGGGGSIGGSIASPQVPFGSGANTITGDPSFTYSIANGLLFTNAGIKNNSPGVLEINNGTAGTFADIKVRTTIHNGYTVATLPAGVAGMTAYVTDGVASQTWGATVSGGGSTKYLVWYNGTAWHVIGN